MFVFNICCQSIVGWNKLSSNAVYFSFFFRLFYARVSMCCTVDCVYTCKHDKKQIQSIWFSVLFSIQFGVARKPTNYFWSLNFTIDLITWILGVPVFTDVAQNKFTVSCCNPFHRHLNELNEVMNRKNFFTLTWTYCKICIIISIENTNPIDLLKLKNPINSFNRWVSVRIMDSQIQWTG